jgi:hypothetical protein
VAGRIADDGRYAPGVDRHRLPLEVERLDGLRHDGVAYEVVRRPADENCIDIGGALKPRGDVDGVAGDEGVLPTGYHLTRVYPGPRGDRSRQARVDGGEGLAHFGGGAHRAQSVVLVDEGDAEHSHDRIADVLLDGAAVSLDHRPHLVEVTRHQRPELLGVEPFAERCRIDDVREQDGYRLAAEPSHFSSLRRNRLRPKRPARAAEAAVPLACTRRRLSCKILWVVPQAARSRVGATLRVVATARPKVVFTAVSVGRV